MVRQLGETIGGWKVGAASAASAAFCAPIWMKMIRPSPASYDARELRLIGIEAEIAFRLGRDLPARAAVYDRAEVTAEAALHPVIEVVDTRYADFRSLDRLSILADNFSNGGLVYGAAVPDWEALDLGHTSITVTEDGEPFADSAAGAARDPVAALVDFANLMNGRGGTKAGTFVTTGSWTGMVFTKRGTRIVADFGRARPRRGRIPRRGVTRAAASRFGCSDELRPDLSRTHAAAAPCRRPSTLGEDEGEPGLKELQGFRQAGRDAQPLTPALDNELGGASWCPGGFYDAVGGGFMRMAKNREQRHAVAMVDRIIAPHAAGNMPAVEAEKLVEFVAGEIQRPMLRPVIRERQHRRTFPAHRYPSPFAAVIQCSRFLWWRPVCLIPASPAGLLPVE